jgi:hypothetical protein
VVRVAKHDWVELKTEYLLGDYKNLSDFATQKGLKRDGNFNKKTKNWTSEKAIKKQQKSKKTIEKTIEKVADKEADRLARINDTADKLLRRIEQAEDQLEQYIVTCKRKTKTVKLDKKFGKCIKEVTVEEEDNEIVDGIVDKVGLKVLAVALRDIKETLAVDDKFKFKREELDLRKKEVEAKEW